MDDASVDTHLCIRCNETIVGIGAYLDHRREDCLGGAGPTTSASSNSAVALGDSAHASNVLHVSGPQTGDARDGLDIPFLPDAPELPDFFLSLDLQRITPLVEPLVDEDVHAGDGEDDEDDPLRPPRGHTGAKWRPGSRPSIMNGLTFHRETLQDHSPERLPEILEKMGCAPCGRIFRDKYTYQRHLDSRLHRKRSLHNAKIIQAQCPPVESQPPDLFFDSPVKRSRCSRPDGRVTRTPLADAEEAQRKKITKKAEHRCSVCFRWFHNIRKLNLHMAEHRGLDGLYCSQCAQRFSDERELRQHLKTHKEHQTCCGTIFTTKKGYREHKERVHPAIREWLACPNCERKYRTSRALREHVCANSITVSCPNCDYVGSPKNLALHQRTHIDDKCYKCSKCGNSFKRHGQLWRHMKLHEGEKTHQCPYCDYSCVLIENLRAHILKGSKHKGLCVYPCVKCSFATNSAAEAKQHQDSHQFPSNNLQWRMTESLSGG